MILGKRTYEQSIVTLEWNPETDDSIVQILGPTSVKSARAKSRKEAANLYLHTSLYEDKFDSILDIEDTEWHYDAEIDAYIKAA